MKILTSSFKSLCLVIFASFVCFEAMAQCQANFTYQVSGCTVNFTNTSTYLSPSPSAPQYAWSFGDGGTATSTNISHTYTATGVYVVCLGIYIPNPFCTDSTCKTITVSCGGTGTNDAFQSGATLSVFSTPGQSNTLIYYNLPKAGQVQITVFDLLGNIVTVLKNSHQNQGDHSLNWNVEALKSGMYFIQLKADGNIITQKVMVTK